MPDVVKKPKNRGAAGRGRPKGSPNKTTRLAKEVIALVAEGLGGVAGMIEWARKNDENEKIFWSQIFTKLLPLQVNSEVDVGDRMAGIVAQWLPRK